MKSTSDVSVAGSMTVIPGKPVRLITVAWTDAVPVLPTPGLSVKVTVAGVVMSAGGVPIEVGGSLLGGVGVSGAPTGETDQECAQAGVEAVQTDLEMSM